MVVYHSSKRLILKELSAFLYPAHYDKTPLYTDALVGIFVGIIINQHNFNPFLKNSIFYTDNSE